jgi:hypothetical protein
MNRNELLQTSDDELLKLCNIDFFKATGPGGQKRNKTESAVRLTLKNSSITATATDDRQQSVNRLHALRRLRQQIAFELREEPTPWDDRLDMNPKNPEYALFLANLLDNLAKYDWQVSEVAQVYGISTGQLIKIFAKYDPLWQFVNQERQKKNYKPLRRS